MLPKNSKITPALAKKLMFTALWFVVVLAAYIFILKYESMTGYILLYVLTAVLLVACIVLNGGFNKDIPTPDDLRDSWSAEKKERFIKALVKGKELAGRLMYLLLPMLITVMIDLVYLFWIS